MIRIDVYIQLLFNKIISFFLIRQKTTNNKKNEKEDDDLEREKRLAGVDGEEGTTAFFRIYGLSKVFWNGLKPVKAIQNLNLTERRRICLSVIGKSGSGKTSLEDVYIKISEEKKDNHDHSITTTTTTTTKEEEEEENKKKSLSFGSLDTRPLEDDEHSSNKEEINEQELIVLSVDNDDENKKKKKKKVIVMLMTCERIKIQKENQ